MSASSSNPACKQEFFYLSQSIFKNYIGLEKNTWYIAQENCGPYKVLLKWPCRITRVRNTSTVSMKFCCNSQSMASQCWCKICCTLRLFKFVVLMFWCIVITLLWIISVSLFGCLSVFPFVLFLYFACINKLFFAQAWLCWFMVAFWNDRAVTYQASIVLQTVLQDKQEGMSYDW